MRHSSFCNSYRRLLCRTEKKTNNGWPFLYAVTKIALLYTNVNKKNNNEGVPSKTCDILAVVSKISLFFRQSTQSIYTNLSIIIDIKFVTPPWLNPKRISRKLRRKTNITKMFLEKVMVNRCSTFHYCFITNHSFKDSLISPPELFN